MLWYSYGSIPCGISDAHFCAAIDDSGRNFEVTNGKEVAKVTLTDSEIDHLIPIYLDTENWRNEFEIQIHLGHDHARHVRLGPESHRVLLQFNRVGGLVAWSGIPFHYASCDLSEFFDPNVE